jgi:sugar phosphate isomerase/epimerase
MSANRSDTKPLRLGGPTFGTKKAPRSLVEYHLRNGFAAAFDPGVQDPVLLDEILQAYAENDIIVAEVDAFGINILEKDEEILEQNVQTICQRLERAERIGALCCVGHGGWVVRPRYRYHRCNPENFSQASIDKMIPIIQRIVDAVEPVKTRYTLETENCYLPDNPDVYLEMIEAVDRPGFAVHLDPTNIISSVRRYYFSGDFIRECFAKLGPYIRSCHAKDIDMGRTPNFLVRTFAGNGELDYDTFLTEIVELEADVPLMIEHVTEPQMKWSRDYIYERAEAVGIRMRNSEFRQP